MVQRQDYAHRVKQLSHQWAMLSTSDKQAYQAQAEFEETQLKIAKASPLPSKLETCPQEFDVGRHSLEKISAARLVTNYENANNHPIWSRPTQLSGCPLPEYRILLERREYRVI